MRVERGLTLGKFLPLHQGHELLLTVAAAYCNELTVLIGTTPGDPYSFQLREKWVREVVQSRSAMPQGRLVVVEDPDPDPQVAKNDKGTVVDENYWSKWMTQNASHLDRLDLIFTSDAYGGEIGRRTGAAWFPVDPDRTVFPISGSQILADPIANFDRISNAAKPDVGLTVAVLGAESTGKSTLIAALAERFGSSFAPEWGRTISEVKPVLDEADFDAIVDMQARLIRSAQCSGNGLCFTDTEAVTTALFAPLYLGSEHAGAWKAARAQCFDLYLVLAPTVPWVNDGTRILDNTQRDQFHAKIVAALDKLGRPFVQVDATDFPARLTAAADAVENLLLDRNWTT